MTTQEKKEELNEAILMIQQAQEIVMDLIGDNRALANRFEAFGKFGFDQLLGNGNPNDESLFNVIEEL